MQILDGKRCSEFYRAQISEIVKKIIAGGNSAPRLSLFMIGDNKNSELYVKLKEKACRDAGIETRVHVLSENASEERLKEMIYEENADPETAGILIQLPLPGKFNESRILEFIDPARDVECFLPVNIGGMFLRNDTKIVPCTPLGIMKLLKYYEIDVAAKEVCIIGRSNLVGKPLALLMLSANATVTVCHSKTRNLAEITKRADILISAAGRAGMIDDKFIKPGAVVIDVGSSRVKKADGKYEARGDCDFEKVSKVAGHMTPVPGGIGPMTITMLLYNTVYNYILMKKLDITMNI